MDISLNTEQSVLEEIVKFIKQVNYGEIVVTIHDSEVVQIEKREKKRFGMRKRLCKQS